ncbi:MAG TPA: lyase family protein, partial [Gammaproteobacteria bacterium]
MAADFRVERDSMGELQVPASALWGAQTQRAVNNFSISGLTMPAAFIRALALVKWAAAHTNRSLGLLPDPIAGAIEASALKIANGLHAEQFPIDVFQTGSGTSSNMNANEVIAKLATQALGSPVHANDHVNMSQSSNDSIPSAIHIAAALELKGKLLPALEHLIATIDAKAKEIAGIVKTGRTHLMDAMPVRLDQELGGWSAQILSNIFRLRGTLPRLTGLAQGGTAVGTGINAHPEFAARFNAALAKRTGV